MTLEKINAKDLLFTGNIEDDRTNTYFHLSDYDWMNYTLETRFRTERMGTLEVQFEYFGSAESVMIINQTFGDISRKIEYGYPTDIFKKYHVKFLERHIRHWDEEYAFNGEDIVIDFFNEVLDVGVIKSILPVNKE